MVSNILSIATSWVVHIISTLGYGGIIFLMALHSAAIPIPSEIVMPFSGFLVSTGRFNFWLVALCGTLGNLLGATAIYLICYFGGRKLIENYGHHIFIPPHELEKVDKFFHRFGAFAIFLGRCIPVVATFISIPAAIAKVKYWKFALFTFLGAIIWNVLLTYIGYKLGKNWLALRDKFHNLDLVIVLLVLGGAAFWLWKHLKPQSLKG